MMDATGSWSRLVVLSSLVVLAACGAPADGGGGGDDGGWTIGPDAGSGDGGSGNERHRTAFRLENTGDAEIRVQATRECRTDPPAWLELDVGDGAPVEIGCQPCDCETLEAGDECGPCPLAGACAPPSVETVPAGESIAWEWSGNRYADDEVGGQTCERREIPEAGTPMQATFCWSAEAGPSGQNTQLEEPTCETVEFAYAEQTSVTHEVSPENSEPQPTDFVLENDSGREVQILQPSVCHSSEYPWVSLREEEMDLATDCTVCSCEDARSGVCGVCERGCPRPAPVALEPGDSESLEWDGVGWTRRQIEGQTCHERRQPEPGEELSARFCWAVSPDRDPICETVDFEYGEGTVRHAIEEVRELRSKTFRLENQTDATLRVQSVGNCFATPPGWMSVHQEGEPQQITSRCGCSCGTLEDEGTCAVCDVACAIDRVEAVEPGGAASWSWEGRHFVSDEVDGQSCTRERIPALGEGFEARFCWSGEEGPTGEEVVLEEETCETVEFGYGGINNRVVHRVGSE